jgi:hypothetical protein
VSAPKLTAVQVDPVTRVQGVPTYYIVTIEGKDVSFYWQDCAFTGGAWRANVAGRGTRDVSLGFAISSALCYWTTNNGRWYGPERVRVQPGDLSAIGNAHGISTGHGGYLHDIAGRAALAAHESEGGK